MTDKTPMSVDDAIAALQGDDVSAEARAEDTLLADEQDEEIDAEAEFQADADDDGDDPEADPDADEDEEADEPEAAIEAPQFLDEKERAAFAALPRAAQDMILKHDKAMVADYTRKTQALAEDRKAAQAQRQQLEQVVERYSEVLPEAERKLAEWQNVDWQQLAARVSAEQYNQFRASYEADAKRIHSLRAEKQQAETISFKAYVAEQAEELRRIAKDKAPELIAPDAGEKVFKPLVEYAREQGYSDDEIRYIGANDMVILHKAWKFDQMMARRKDGKAPALTPKPDAKSTGKPVRAGAASSTSKRAVTKDVQQQFRKTGSTKLAISMLQDLD